MSTCEVQDYGLAAVCAYSGYPLASVRIEGGDTWWIFSMHDWSLKEIADAYYSPEGQPLSSAKHFCDAVERVKALQRKARQSRDGLWTNPRWIAGEDLKRSTSEYSSEPVDCGKF